MIKNAKRYLGPWDRQTSSYPQRFLCTDGQEYIVKFNGLPLLRKLAINEFVAARLAQLLELGVPDFCFVRIPPELIEQEGSLKRLGVSPGLHFGTRRENRAQQVSLGAIKTRIANLETIPGVFILDFWIYNYDRQNNRGNLLYRQRDDKLYEILVIDHGDAFGGRDWKPEQICGNAFCDIDRFAISGTLLYDELAKLVSGEAPFAYHLNLLDTISEEQIDAILGDIPDEWDLNDQEFWALRSFILCRQPHIRESIQTYRGVDFPYWRGVQIKWNFLPVTTPS